MRGRTLHGIARAARASQQGKADDFERGLAARGLKLLRGEVTAIETEGALTLVRIRRYTSVDPETGGPGPEDPESYPLASGPVPTLGSHVFGVERAGGGVVFGQNDGMCELTRNGDLPVDHNTWTPVPFDNEITDTMGAHFGLTNPHLVSPGAGRYAVDAYTRWATNSTGNRFVRLMKNGQEVMAPTGVQASVFSAGAGTLHWSLSLAAADAIHVEVLQSSGASLNLLAAVKLNVMRV